MKYLWIGLAFLLVASFAHADVGLSPDYIFSISNASDYPDYDFYYVGKIWEDLFPVEDETDVYKLDTLIVVHAVPKGVDVQGNFEGATAQSVKSQEIDLDAGHTIYKIASFNEVSKTMQLEVEDHTQDTSLDPFMFVIVAVIVFLVGVLAVIWFVLLGQKRKVKK